MAGALLWQNHKPEVEIAQARVGPAVELVYATGFVEPDQPVSIASRLTAPVVQVLVDEGNRVVRGQPLVCSRLASSASCWRRPRRSAARRMPTMCASRRSTGRGG